MLPEKQRTDTIFLRKKRAPTILAVGAHPDDIEVGCGGTLRVLTDLGYEVYEIVLTDGGNGGNRKERVKEALTSGRILGLKKVFPLLRRFCLNHSLKYRFCFN